MDKKSQEYWKKRSQILEQATFDNTKDEYKKIAKAFDKSQKEIQAKIDKWLARIAKNNGDITLEEARELLNKNELAEFKWTVKEYIKYGEENAIDQRWMKELENASAKHHIDKLTALKLECQAEYDKAFNTENQKVTDAVKEAYTDRYDHVGYEVQKGFNVGFKLNGISEEKLDKVMRKPWAPDGKNFSDRIWTKKEQMVEELYQALVRNTLGGSNLKDVIDSMTKYVDKSTKNAKSAAARLVMTESAYFASQGQKDCFNDLGVEKYEIVATLDNKTTEICQGLDGKVFEMKEFEPGTTAPPFHVNCRSTTAPYFDDEFSLGERAARDAEGKTYYVPSDMTYKEWKKKQDEPVSNDNNGVFKKLISIPDGYDIDKHDKEIKNANIVYNKLGGNIQMLNERVDQKTADMIWNDKLWEIKNVSSHSSIDHAIRNGLKQIIDNQGGIILNIDNSKLELDEIKSVIQKRFNRTGEEYKNLNVILIKNDKLLESMVIEKEAFPSAKKGTSSASYNSNSIINIAKSQLKNDEKDDKINIINNDKINKMLSNTSLEDKYKQVTTIEEAKEYAKNVLNIDLTNLEKTNIDILNIMLKESSRVYDKFGDLSQGQVLEGIRKVKFPNNSNTVAGYHPGFREVLVDKVMSKKDLQSIINDTIANHNSGAWSTRAKEHFIRHELGHAVEHLYNSPEKKLKLNDIINDLKNELGIKGDIKLKDFNSNDIDIIKKAGEKTSYYALKDYKELVAESVAEFMNGNPRDVAQEVISVLMEGVV